MSHIKRKYFISFTILILGPFIITTSCQDFHKRFPKFCIWIEVRKSHLRFLQITFHIDLARRQMKICLALEEFLVHFREYRIVQKWISYDVIFHRQMHSRRISLGKGSFHMTGTWLLLSDDTVITFYPTMHSALHCVFIVGQQSGVTL